MKILISGGRRANEAENRKAGSGTKGNMQRRESNVGRGGRGQKAENKEARGRALAEKI